MPEPPTPNGTGSCAKRGRFWEVTDAAGQLVCLAVYKKGAGSPAPPWHRRHDDHNHDEATDATQRRSTMIYPTEMTLATGTTVYAGDPASDQRIQSREVRVSVTFRIEEEEDDFDLADFAYAKAAEVERARMAAQDRIERDRLDPYNGVADGPVFEDAHFDPSAPGLEPPDEELCHEENDRVTPDPFPDEANYLHAPGGQAPNGHSPGSSSHSRYGLPTHSPASAVGTGPVTRTETVSQVETDWATRPQVLAIGSHFRRLGISPQDQTALLRDRFGKFRPERLTRNEAANLMRSLERGEVAAERSEVSAERNEPGRDGRAAMTAIPSAH